MDVGTHTEESKVCWGSKQCLGFVQGSLKMPSDVLDPVMLCNFRQRQLESALPSN